MNLIINDSVVTENFSSIYPIINKYMFENANFQDSRNGSTKEILDFKTTITNPYKRCVGNNGRNINVFFLIAEAIWIFAGKKDLKTLELFNAQMSEYSDDGKYFHAPYGFRIRHNGLSSFDEFPLPKTEENAHGRYFLSEGRDQLYDALMELSENPDSRQVVLQIWDANLDLSTKTKDKPCNDLVMFKIRDRKLCTTIANRSNDLHWGLPTNIFQFSFLSEIISLILGIELGRQTHNSQSLHFYLDNPIAEKMYENVQFEPSFKDLYDFCEEERIQMNFSENSGFSERLKKIDYYFNKILHSFVSNNILSDSEVKELKNFSPQIALYYELCAIFLHYKTKAKIDLHRAICIDEIYHLSKSYGKILDVMVLAQNFFYSRIKDKTQINDNYLFCSNML